ncbi:MAG: hypothetical protein K2N63_12535, partial [Lachnospiraceae bacterium]|nr:hypothetical protein [Lachnospiraceae bacterium]
GESGQLDKIAEDGLAPDEAGIEIAKDGLASGEARNEMEKSGDNVVVGESGQLGKTLSESEKATERSVKLVDGAVEADGKNAEVPQEKQDLKSRLLAEISAFPLDSLKKTLGVKQLLAVASQKKSGQEPKIAYSSIITVQLPKGGNTVKLLSPLEYSTCSCHKKEFCVHKAAAVLWCKLMAKEVTEEELSGAEELQEYAMEEVNDAAQQIKGFLTELLGTGLARTSPDVLDYLDRLALISHNAKLANFEGYMRALHDSYGNYLKRKASFDVKKLMEQFARLYKRVELLLQAADAVQVSVLAGEFRSEYAPVGNLSLMGIVMEHFESQTGYEGETVYFLEENTKEWYTYTSARPVFYDTTGRRGRQEKASAPWGLPVSVKDMVGIRLHLSGARCDVRGRLSASAETKGEVTGSCQKENCLHTGELGNWYYRDFGKLFIEQVGTMKMPWLKETQEERKDGELVFLRPYSFTRGEFSKTEQKLTMWLYDRAGREVVLELAYSKREEWGIGYLERLTEDKEPCFLGKLYFKDGRMRLYPVTVFEKGELAEDLECGMENDRMERGSNTEEEMDGGVRGGRAAGAKENTDGSLEAIDVLSGVLEDVGSLFEELYQSGLDTVHDSTLEGLTRMGKLTKQYGLSNLSGMLARLTDGVAMRRHRLGQKTDGLAAVYAEACEYLYLCRGKVEMDRGREYYSCATGEKQIFSNG